MAPILPVQTFRTEPRSAAGFGALLAFPYEDTPYLTPSDDYKKPSTAWLLYIFRDPLS